MIRSGFTFQYSLPDAETPEGGGGDSPEPIKIEFEYNGVSYVYLPDTVSFVDGEGESFYKKELYEDTYFWKLVNGKYIYFKVDSNDDIYYGATGDVTYTGYVNGIDDCTIYIDGNVTKSVTANGTGNIYINGNATSYVNANGTGNIYINGNATSHVNANGTGNIYVNGNINTLIGDGTGNIYVNGNINTLNGNGTVYVNGNINTFGSFGTGGNLYVSGTIGGNHYDLGDITTGAGDIVTSAMDEYIKEHIDDIIYSINSWYEVNYL